MIGHAEIKLILPHRHPMLLVDAVLNVEPGARIVAIKNISLNEPCFADAARERRPAPPSYPAVLLIESFCQAAGILEALSRGATRPAQDHVMLFGAMANVEFHDDAHPGDTLIHHVRLETALSDAAVFSGEVRTSDRLIATIGRVIVAIRPASALRAVAAAPAPIAATAA
jgi:3-hydroxyacyl-[acyl-carrier-protein] dehydratase